MSKQATRSLASKKLIDKIYSSIENLDKRPIRGEFKAWIYKFYLVPSIQFSLMIDQITIIAISKIQRKITCYLKKWLGLPRCATLATLFHPKLTNLPYLPHAHQKAKARFLAASILSPTDFSLQEMKSLITSSDLIKSHSICNQSVSTISKSDNPPDAKSFKSVVRLLNKNLVDLQTEEWNSHLESLSVQCKLLDVTDLEKKSNVWSRIIFSMPAGQLSFLLRAGTDCLPTPMNLSRWKIHIDPSCCLCLSKLCTTNHILNCCPEALSQNRRIYMAT